MNKPSWKALLPHLIAVAIFLIASVLYCKPALEGKMVEQPDLMQWKGMAQDGFNYLEKHGDLPEWTNSMFGGMPAYQIAFESTAYLPAYATMALSLFLPQPIAYFFLACICFYFLSQVLRVNTWIGILAALGYAFASYNPIIIVTGHHTKMLTIAVMPALVASVLLIFEYRKYWLGFALTALFTSMVVVNNHLQMVYYTLIIMLFMGAAYAIKLVRSGAIGHLVKSTGIAVAAAIVGALVCAVNLFTTYDYAPESMRGGKNQLVMNETDSATTSTTKGLDADYAFRWSYGLPETFSLAVPNVNGGASTPPLDEESKFYQTLIEKVQSRQMDEGTAQQVAQFGTPYWGDQPFTSGPVYLGAIICLFFFLAMVNYPGIQTWWMLAASAFAILLAWGSNLMGFNQLMFDYLPLYNRFRAPSQSLVIPQLLFPMAGMLGLQQLLFGTEEPAARWKQLRTAGLVMAGLLIAVGLYYLMADFNSARESETLAQVAKDQALSAQLKEVFAAAAEDRKAMFGADLLRSTLFAAFAFGVLFFASRNQIKATLAVGILLVFSTIDLMGVGKRYLTDDNYVDKEETEIKNYVTKVNPGLAQVLSGLEADPDLHFRVFNTASDPFNDALTAAYVRSVGGYHPAKLSRYQDLIEYQLSKQNLSVFNMLDTKYFIVNTDKGLQAQQNPAAFGAAWLVKHVHVVPNAAAEMRSLDSLNLRDTAIIEAAEKPLLTTMPTWDSAASIKLTVYDNDLIKYDVVAPKTQFAVLSEIYYPRGWKAFADGKEVPIIKTNYLLRGVLLPAGTKALELRFEPESYARGKMVTAAAEILILLLFAVAIFMEVRKKPNTAGSESKS